MKTNLRIPIALVMLIVFAGCSAKITNSQKPFKVTDVYYYSWMLGEDEKGTDIIIEVTNREASVEFKSITYRGIEVPVSVTEEGRSLIIKGTINTGESTIDNMEYRVTGEPDKINYTNNGSGHSYPLINIRRENSKYYRR
ncbi:MAG: hypothetical protein K8R35_02310 [Bacteroidales bacterium]|nr:hypothetical protein [Bacteroidales bacterium]